MDSSSASNPGGGGGGAMEGSSASNPGGGGTSGKKIIPSPRDFMYRDPVDGRVIGPLTMQEIIQLEETAYVHLKPKPGDSVPLPPKPQETRRSKRRLSARPLSHRKKLLKELASDPTTVCLTLERHECDPADDLWDLDALLPEEEVPGQEHSSTIESKKLASDSMLAEPSELSSKDTLGHESDSADESGHWPYPVFLRKLDEYRAARPTYTNLFEALAAIQNGFPPPAERVPVRYVPPAEVEPPSRLLPELEDLSLQAPGHHPSQVPKSSVPLPSSREDLPLNEESSMKRKKKLSAEEISQNGKKWMSEEVMVAFQKYMEGRHDSEGAEYKLDELLHQCFSMESYYKIWHHFNFTVRMKMPSSADWTTKLYFAEVMEISGYKMYFCYPLESSDNGHCYACKNQRMDKLKHPTEGGYDPGDPDSGCPFFVDYDDDSSMSSGADDSSDDMS